MPLKNDISELPKFFDAAARNDLQKVRYFIEERDTPPVIGDSDRQTVAHIAAKNGHLDMLRYIVEKEPTVLEAADSFGNTVLFLAIERGDINIVRYLIDERKEEPFQRHRSVFECTTLNQAIEFGHFDVLKYLVEEKGADVNLPNNLGEPPIFYAILYEQPRIFKYLVEERNANMTLRDCNDDNILYKTVVKDDLPSMKYILDERKVELDLNWKNSFGDTLVHRACTLNSSAILEYLVDVKKADIHLLEDGINMTSLHLAAFQNNLETCKFLIERGASPQLQVKDIFGKTPIDKATDPPIIEYLQNISTSRSRRSVGRPSNFAVPVLGDLSQGSRHFPLTQLTDGRLGVSLADSFHDIFRQNFWGDVMRSSILHDFLAITLTTIRGGRETQEWGSEDTRIDPVAIDVINYSLYDTDQESDVET